MILIFSVIIAILFLALLLTFIPLNLTLKGKVILFLASVCTSFIGLAIIDQVSIWGAIAVQLLFSIVLTYLMTKRFSLFRQDEEESALQKNELQPFFRYEELLEKANMSNREDEYEAPPKRASFIKEELVSSQHSEAETKDVHLFTIQSERFEEPKFVDLRVERTQEEDGTLLLEDDLELIDMKARMVREQEESRSQPVLEEAASILEDELEFIDIKARMAEDRSQPVLEEAAPMLEDELEFIDMKARIGEEQEEDKEQTFFELEDESNDFMELRMKMFEEIDEVQALPDENRKGEEIKEKQTTEDDTEKAKDVSSNANPHLFEDLEELYLKNKQKRDGETV